MLARCGDDPQLLAAYGQVRRLPPVHFNDPLRIHTLPHQPPRKPDGHVVLRLVAECPDGSDIQVVVVVMGDNHRVNGRQVIDINRGFGDAFRPGEAHRGCVAAEHGVGQHVDTAVLEQHGGVADPGDRSVFRGGAVGQRTRRRGGHDVHVRVVRFPVTAETGAKDPEEAPVILHDVRVDEVVALTRCRLALRCSCSREGQEETDQQITHH